VGSPEALSAALALYSNPRLTEALRRARLPKGMTLLLQVAAGEEEALASGSAATGRSPASLQKAAGFFIEQILLAAGTDSYRTFGLEREATDLVLRQHMALILRWLHPDVTGNRSSERRLDRSVFASRVTNAWELVKNSERRSSYHASLGGGTTGSLAVPAPQKPLRVYAIPGDGLFGWFTRYFGGRK